MRHKEARGLAQEWELVPEYALLATSSDPALVLSPQGQLPSSLDSPTAGPRLS